MNGDELEARLRAIETEIALPLTETQRDEVSERIRHSIDSAKKMRLVELRNRDEPASQFVPDRGESG